MESEKILILKMVQEGKVSAEEGARLLQAMEYKAPGSADRVGLPAKWLRVRVREGDGNVVNVNLPVALLDVALSLGLKFVPKEEIPEIDIPAILEAIKTGASGKIVEVTTKDIVVEITVE